MLGHLSKDEAADNFAALVILGPILIPCGILELADFSVEALRLFQFCFE